MEQSSDNQGSLFVYIGYAISLIVITVLCRFCSDTTPPEDIRVSFIPTTPDSIGIKIEPNEILTFLGFCEHENSAWVENKTGERGIIEYTPESFRIISNHKMDDLEGYTMFEDKGYYYISLEKVKSFCIGKKREEIERRWRLARIVHNTSTDTNEEKKTTAFFLHVAALTSRGTFNNFVADFNDNGECEQIRTLLRVKETNSFMLSRLPYVQTIAGWDWLMANVQDELYCSDHSDWAWYIRWPYNIISFFWTYGIWALFMALVPLWLIVGCMQFDFMRFVPNSIVLTIGSIVTLVWSYIWMVAILCWGYWWPFYIPLLFITVASGILSVHTLMYSGQDGIGIRCPKCGRAMSYKPIRYENRREEILIKPVSERVSSHDYIDQNSMKTYRCTYRRFSDEGPCEIDCGTRTYVIRSYRKYTHYEYVDWKEYYNVTKADVTERCSCGEERYLKDIVTNKVFSHRDKVGTHSTDVPFTTDTVEGEPQGTEYRYELINSVEI